MNACLRHTAEGWHLGYVTPDPMIDNFDRQVRVDELGTVVAELGLGVGSIDVREDVPADDYDAVLTALGRRCRTAARYTDPRFTVTTTEG